MAKQKKNVTKSKAIEDHELVKREYSEEEEARVATFLKHYERRLAKFTSKKDSSGKRLISAEEKDNMLALVKMAEALGTPDSGLQNYFITQAVYTFRACNSSKDLSDNELSEFVNHSLAILQGIVPQDEIEGMLAIQMIGVHNLAMETMRRAMIVGQTPIGKQENINQATKLLRTFTAQMEALKKYRTGGQQKVTVEHVNVNKGGQAIVGNVTTGRGCNDGKGE